MYIDKNTIFLVDKEKDKPDGKLRYRIRWGKNIVAFNVGFRIDLDKWSKDTQRCKNNTTHGKKKISASVINRAINHFEQISDDVFNSFDIAGTTPSADEFRSAFNIANGKEVSKDIKAKGFFDIFDEFVKTMGFQNAWTNATYTKFSAIRKHLYAFDEKLSFEELSERVLQLFVQYQMSVPLKNTTIAKNIGFVRWFIRWAYNHDYYNGKLHDTFKPKLKGTDGNSKEVIHLTWDELIDLYNFQFTENKMHLDRVRDVFCFCCFTGLRYSDVAKLKRSDVKAKSISVVTQKTVDTLKIELNDYSHAILSKYIDIPFPQDKALPVISNQRMNDELKDMGELVGLDEPQRIVYFMGNERVEEVYPKYALLTTHCGRRTFIVNALYLGISAETIMKWTGHSDYKAMKPYIKIVDELKEQEMSKFNRK